MLDKISILLIPFLLKSSSNKLTANNLVKISIFFRLHPYKTSFNNLSIGTFFVNS